MKFGPVCHAGGISGCGNPEHGVMLLGIAPGRDELKTGRPMTGASGKLIDNILDTYGWSRDKCYATNVLCTSIDTTSSSLSLEKVLACRPRLNDEVSQFKPKLVVLLGNPVTELFFPLRKPGAVRGMIDYYAPWGCHVLPTYHPAAILYGAGEFVSRDIVRDFAKIPEFFNNPPRPDVDWFLVTDPARAQEIMNSFPTDKFCVLDVETRMDKDADDTVPVDNGIVWFSITCDGLTYSFPGSMASRITWRTDLMWTFQNGIFDTIELQDHIGVLLPIKHDTLYMSYCLDERGGRHGLKSLAREYEGAGFYEEHKLLKKWDDKVRDTEWVEEYNARDTAYTERIAQRFYPKLADDDMLWVYDNLLIPAANVYRHMQRHGIYLNKERYSYLANEWIPLLRTKEAALKAKVATLGGDPHINVGSPKQLAKFLYGVLRLPGGPSTAAPIIEALADEHEFIGDLLDLRKLEKAVNTYVVGAWDDIKSTGRLHPSPMLHGTVGGRCAYSPYAINTLPRATSENTYLSRIRWLFTAPDPDHVLIELDFSQAEIYTAYAYCRDRNMLADLQSGDFHRSNAAYIKGVTLAQVTDEWRSDAKRTTFGMFYGIGVAKLAKQIKKSQDETAALQAGWRTRYIEYVHWGNSVVKQINDDGEVVTLSGRKRRFPIPLDTSIVNAAINFPIQSTAHDALMLAIIAAYPVCESLDAHIIIDNHDAMLIEAKKSNAMEVTKRVAEIMINAGSKIPGMINIPAEAKMGYSWAELEKVKL